MISGNYFSVFMNQFKGLHVLETKKKPNAHDYVHVSAAKWLQETMFSDLQVAENANSDSIDRFLKWWPFKLYIW